MLWAEVPMVKLNFGYRRLQKAKLGRKKPYVILRSVLAYYLMLRSTSAASRSLLSVQEIEIWHGTLVSTGTLFEES
jgi:hypothetical protein